MPKLSHHTKHIGLPHHWLKSKLSSLEIDIEAVKFWNEQNILE